MAKKKAQPRKLDLGTQVAIAGVAAGVIGAVAAVIVVPEFRCWSGLDKCVDGKASTEPRPASSPCEKPYLRVSLNDRIGTLVAVDAPHPDWPRRFRVVVGNPTTSCTAIVSKVFVDVVAAVPDHHPALEAMDDVYKLKAQISRFSVGNRILVSDLAFNYTPLSKPDEFAIDIVSRDKGIAYALRFGLIWKDLATNRTNVTKTWVALAPYPDGQAQIFGGDTSSAWRKDQLLRWRRQLDRSQDAVNDAQNP